MAGSELHLFADTSLCQGLQGFLPCFNPYQKGVLVDESIDLTLMDA